MFLYRKIFTIIFLLASIINLMSQSVDSVGKRNDIERSLSEVVVTGQIESISQINAIQKITIIGQDILETRLFQNLSDILKFSNNLNISQDNILGSSINLQGISGQNIKILIDEVPVIGRLNGNIDLSQISLDNVERIEIVEGPLSVEYGTDALAGTINIITKKDYPEGITSSIKTLYESVGRYNADLTLNYRIRNHSLTSHIGRNYFSGWSVNDKFQIIPTSQIADTNRFKLWNPKEQIFGKLQYILSRDKIENRIYADYFYEKILNRGMPKPPYFENAFDDHYYTYRKNIGSETKYKNDKYQIRAIFSINNYKRIKNTFYKDLVTLDEVMVSDNNSQDTSIFQMIMAKFRISPTVIRRLNYQLGFHFENQYALGERILRRNQSQSDIALYSNLEWKINLRTKVRSGLRLIHNTKYKAPIIPSLSLLYKLNNAQIRMSYAKGFRAPTLKELFFEFVDVNHNIVGNEDLLSEKSDNVNISTLLYRRGDNFLSSFEMSAFLNNINNKIDLAESTIYSGQYSYFNIDRYITKGFSSNVRFSNKKIKSNFGVSYTGRYNSFNSIHEINKFDFSIDFNNSITYLFDDQFRINLFYKYVGARPYYYLDESDMLVTLNSSDYHLFDLSLNRDILSNKVQISIGSKNIFNVTNITNRSNNDIHSYSGSSTPVGYGRSYFVTLSYKI